MAYSATVKGPFKVAGYHDKDSKRLFGLKFKPPIWAADTVYYVWDTDYFDIVIPTVFKGLYFKVTNPGLSGATEPVWPTLVGDTVNDNGIIWEAVAYNLMPITETISDSTWTASNSVTISQQNFTASTTQVRIDSVPAGVDSFTLTNHYVKNNGEEDDVTLLFKVAER
jgi:hypothetical protein